MTIALAALLVVIAALLVDRFVTARQHRTEVGALHEAILDVNRQAVMSLLSRNGADFARNEAVGRATAETLAGTREPREHVPMPEGL